jgi:hypothetical protein
VAAEVVAVQGVSLQEISVDLVVAVDLVDRYSLVLPEPLYRDLVVVPIPPRPAVAAVQELLDLMETRRHQTPAPAV